MSPPYLEIFIPTDWHNNILYSQIQRNCLGINWNITSAKEFKIGENHHKIIKKGIKNVNLQSITFIDLFYLLIFNLVC